ncbi:hypothetical protein [Sorangium sp. So ce542]|uniref:hypothetical protein n=1 Tax=Sorangium sp. So ce542 TaxID=3133316 RepID=UPI003F63A125
MHGANSLTWATDVIGRLQAGWPRARLDELMPEAWVGSFLRLPATPARPERRGPRQSTRAERHHRAPSQACPGRGLTPPRVQHHRPPASAARATPMAIVGRIRQPRGGR